MLPMQVRRHALHGHSRGYGVQPGSTHKKDNLARADDTIVGPVPFGVLHWMSGLGIWRQITMKTCPISVY